MVTLYVLHVHGPATDAQMTFVPEWIIGSPVCLAPVKSSLTVHQSLDTANPLHLWLYLTLSNR